MVRPCAAVWRLIPGQISIHGLAFFITSALVFNFKPKMIRRYIHPLDQIEPMGVEALHPGIQLQIFAALLAGLLRQPVKKLTAETRSEERRVGKECRSR